MDQSAYFEQIRRKRREEILDAARAMILAAGMDSFNIQKLARTLDISAVTLYKYFKNSDDILLALQKEILGQWTPVYQNFSSGENALDDFLRFIEDFFADAMEHQEELSLLLLFQMHSQNQETPDTMEAMAQLIRPHADRLTGFFTDLLIRAKQERELKKDLDINAAVSFICGLNFAVVQRIALLLRRDFQKEKGRLMREIRELGALYRLYLAG